MHAAPIHMTVTTGVLNPDGKLLLEGETSSAFSKVHFSFDGTATRDKLSGNITIDLNNAGQIVNNKGEITLIPAR
jgi:hypothetical protein